MKREILFMAVGLLMIGSTIKAQVTVGADTPPEKAALLDLKTEKDSKGGISSTGGGLLLPRVDIINVNTLNVFSNPNLGLTDGDAIKHKGLMVYNIGTVVDEGIYTWDGKKWLKASFNQKMNFFYMPSVVIDTRTAGAGTVDLYAEYQKQFAGTKADGSKRVKSTNAPETIPVYKRDELYYYVTDYDDEVFEDINIDDNGNMSYTVKDPPTDGASYMNIVFVVK